MQFYARIPRRHLIIPLWWLLFPTRGATKNLVSIMCGFVFETFAFLKSRCNQDLMITLGFSHGLAVHVWVCVLYISHVAPKQKSSGKYFFRSSLSPFHQKKKKNKEHRATGRITRPRETCRRRRRRRRIGFFLFYSEKPAGVIVRAIDTCTPAQWTTTKEERLFSRSCSCATRGNLLTRFLWRRILCVALFHLQVSSLRDD